jgi:preprotein translocase subunit SecF
MFRFFDDARYDVLKLWKPAMIVTAAFVLPGLALFALRGLNLSIEFTGGTLIEVHADSASIRSGSIRSALDSHGITGAEIQTFGAPNEFVIRARLNPRAEASHESTQQTVAAVDSALSTTFGKGAYVIARTEAVGPKVGGELRQRAALALLMGMGATFLILWFRYEWRFGLAAQLATLHDILATFAFMAYLNLEVSLVVVAAFLTLVGYSLNDTIVTFDRVRENLKKSKRQDMYEVLNRSINETLPRTVLTSGTTAVATLALLLLGGTVIRPFAWVMTFGIVTGTFSSIYIASPVLWLIERRWPSEDARGVRATMPKTTVSVTS